MNEIVIFRDYSFLSGGVAHNPCQRIMVQVKVVFCSSLDEPVLMSFYLYFCTIIILYY